MNSAAQGPPENLSRFSPPLGLSARLLLLTIFFVMLAEVLIYVPSIARFRAVYLSERLAAAQLASLALEAAPDHKIPQALERELLANAGAYAVVLWRDDTRHLMLSSHRDVAADLVFDVREDRPWVLILGAFDALWPYNTGHGENGGRVISVMGPPRLGGGVIIESIIDEGPLKMEMYDYSGRILNLSIVISLITASLVFFSLRMLLVRPIQRITRSMVAFREAPEDVSRIIAPSGRRDEIGTAQRTLAEMQEQIRVALKQKNQSGAGLSRGQTADLFRRHGAGYHSRHFRIRPVRRRPGRGPGSGRQLDLTRGAEPRTHRGASCHCPTGPVTAGFQMVEGSQNGGKHGMNGINVRCSPLVYLPMGGTML